MRKPIWKGPVTSPGSSCWFTTEPGVNNPLFSLLFFAMNLLCLFEGTKENHLIKIPNLKILWNFKGAHYSWKDWKCKEWGGQHYREEGGLCWPGSVWTNDRFQVSCWLSAKTSLIMSLRQQVKNLDCPGQLGHMAITPTWNAFPSPSLIKAVLKSKTLLTFF